MTYVNKEHSSIREVWKNNFEQEINILSELVEKYPYISIDTEFPGTIHSNLLKGKEATYKGIKANVDDLRLIQFGLTLTDEKGNNPQGVCTWQFNMNFDVKNDKYSSESINLLINHGINFDKLAENGISPEEFGDLLTTSGLVLNDETKWVSFHGSYDFSYLIKLLTNMPLPDTESGFFNIMKIYFPVYYDTKHLSRNFDNFFGKSLQKLAQELDIERIGTLHQAGSDSLVTSKVFHKLLQQYITNDNLIADQNVLYGLGTFYEDESIPLFEAPNIIVNNLNSIGSINNSINLGNTGVNKNINSLGYNSANSSSVNSNLMNVKQTPNQYEMNYFNQSQYYQNINPNYFKGSTNNYPFQFNQYNQNYLNQVYNPSDYINLNEIQNMNSLSGSGMLNNNLLNMNSNLGVNNVNLVNFNSIGSNLNNSQGNTTGLGNLSGNEDTKKKSY